MNKQNQWMKFEATNSSGDILHFKMMAKNCCRNGQFKPYLAQQSARQLFHMKGMSTIGIKVSQISVENAKKDPNPNPKKQSYADWYFRGKTPWYTYDD